MAKSTPKNQINKTLNKPSKKPELQQKSSDAIVMILAGPPERVNAWFNVLQMDSRFRVNTFSTDPQDLATKLSYNPEAILLDTSIFSGPEHVIGFLTKAQCAVYIVLPRGIEEDQVKEIRELPSVKGVYVDDINLTEVSGRIFAEVKALRAQAPALESATAALRRGQVMGGLRVITVWNRAGGVGKSTISAALALEAAQRGFKTLLIGLSSPDISLPTILDLKTTPNMFGWLASPTYDQGIRPNVQSIGNLDVLVGLQDPVREMELTAQAEDPKSINQLVINATFAGYSVVILDTPESGPFINAISASNTMVMPAIPMVDQAVITAEAFRMTFKRLRDQHRIGLGNVFVVLNRYRSGLLSSNEWHEAADAYSRVMGSGTFPPVALVIPDVLDVQLAANAGRSPLTASDEFSTPIHRLGDMLYGGKAAPAFEDEKVFKLGPLQIRRGKK